MKARPSTLDKIAQSIGLRDGNNHVDVTDSRIPAVSYFDTGGFAQSKMDSPVFDQNPDPWPVAEKKSDSSPTKKSKRVDQL